MGLLNARSPPSALCDMFHCLNYIFPHLPCPVWILSKMTRFLGVAVDRRTWGKGMLYSTGSLWIGTVFITIIHTGTVCAVQRNTVQIYSGFGLSTQAWAHNGTIRYELCQELQKRFKRIIDRPPKGEEARGHIVLGPWPLRAPNYKKKIFFLLKWLVLYFIFYKKTFVLKLF